MGMVMFVYKVMKTRLEMANREHGAVVDGEMDTPHFAMR
jgi:hypothetical protein